MKVTLIAALLLLAAPAVAAPERRCGWLHNPTPGNWSLQDREREWEIAQQGAPGAPGFDRHVNRPREWVETNVHYGYGCACLTVELNRRTGWVQRIHGMQALPLARCNADRRLPQHPE